MAVNTTVMNNSHSVDKRRILGDTDVDLAVHAAVELGKVGVAALGLVNHSPEAALGLLAVANLGGVLVRKQEARLAEFLKSWKRRTERMSPELLQRLKENLSTDEGERIFEEAWRIAAGCIDPEKLDYLSELLTNGLASEQLAEHQTRRLLSLIEDIDGVDFVILQGELAGNRAPNASWEPTEEEKSQKDRFEEFRAIHVAIFADEKAPQKPEYPLGGYSHSQNLTPDEEAAWQHALQEYHQAQERHALFQNRIHRLIEMGVLGVETDAYSKMKAGLTPLGMALLKIIGIAPDDEWGVAQATNALDTARQIENQEETHRQSQMSRDKKQKQREQQAAQQFEREARNFVSELRRRIR